MIGVDKDIIEAFAALFRGRTDSHGRVEVCIYEPVTLEHYKKHLKGEVNLGIYFLLDDSTCHFFGIDLDEKDFNKAKAIRDELTKSSIPAYIAESKSRGFHIYGFALERFKAMEIRRVLKNILDNLNIKCEVFPKQDYHQPDDPPSEKYPKGQKHPGSYINLPSFGYTRPFLSGDLKEVPLEVALERIKRVPQEAIDQVLQTLPKEKPLEPKKVERKRRLIYPPCLKVILQGVNQEQRNEAALALARYYLVQRFYPEEAFWLLQEWDAKNKPPTYNEPLLENAVRSAEKYRGFFCSLIKDKPTVSTFCVGDEKCDWLKKLKEMSLTPEEEPDKLNETAMKKLLEACAFLRHCRKDAATLPEPHWWSMCAILSFFGEPGKQKAHELSAPYPKYTAEETNQKLEYAKKAADKDVGPHTCLFIQEDLHFACPDDCKAKEWNLKSPAGLVARLATPKVFNLTDLGNAERLANRHGENIHYSEERKRWLIWTGRVWEWDFGAKIMGLAKETARNILREAADENDDAQRKELIKHAVRSEGEARLTAMVTLAQSEPGIPVQSTELNPSPWLFNCSNGTLALRTGELLPHNRGDLLTIISPVNYDCHAPRTLWARFLDRVTGGSKELAEYLQRAVGYSLTGDMRAQVMFFLFGLGNNGKSTFVGTIRKIMAGYSAKAPVDMFLARDKNARGPREDLANLQGKRFIAASEVEVGRKLAVVIIKEMTGGEAIRADRKYEHEIEFQPTHKLWISGNHKPVIVDTSLAIWRRIKLIPFTVTIPDNEIDEDLPFKMEAELSGILAWAVEGCLAWQQSGLAEPRIVTAATLAYRQEEDILAEFIQDCCILKVTATVPKADLHERYKQWCDATGNQPVSQKTFRTRLMERGITEGHSKSVRYWRGINLLTNEGGGQEGQGGQEMTFFQENHIREDIQGKVPGKSVGNVPPVPSNDKKAEVTPDIPDYPHEVCRACGGSDFWLTEDGRYLCSHCHPEPKGDPYE